MEAVKESDVGGRHLTKAFQGASLYMMYAFDDDIGPDPSRPRLSGGTRLCCVPDHSPLTLSAELLEPFRQGQRSRQKCERAEDGSSGEMWEVLAADAPDEAYAQEVLDAGMGRRDAYDFDGCHRGAEYDRLDCLLSGLCRRLQPTRLMCISCDRTIATGTGRISTSRDRTLLPHHVAAQWQVGRIDA